jgi:hypothetical protein
MYVASQEFLNNRRKVRRSIRDLIAGNGHLAAPQLRDTVSVPKGSNAILTALYTGRAVPLLGLLILRWSLAGLGAETQVYNRDWYGDPSAVDFAPKFRWERAVVVQFSSRWEFGGAATEADTECFGPRYTQNCHAIAGCTPDIRRPRISAQGQNELYKPELGASASSKSMRLFYQVVGAYLISQRCFPPLSFKWRGRFKANVASILQLDYHFNPHNCRDARE